MKTTRKTALLALLLASAAAGLVACHQPGQVDPTDSPSAAECSPPLTASLGCDIYRSTAATEEGKTVPWVSESSIDVKAEILNEAPTLVVTTPCNVLNIPLELDGTTFRRGDIVSTMTGCDAERTARQRWVEDFFRTDIQWERTETTLTLRGDGAVLEFEAGLTRSSG